MSSLYPLGTEVTLFFAFTDEDGNPADPTTVEFTVELPDGSVVTSGIGDPGVTNPAVGDWEFTYLPPEPGAYQYKVAGTGTVTASSPTGTFVVTGDAISTEWSVAGGPCEPWITSGSVAECCGVADPDVLRLEQAAHAATELLYVLSGSRYSGQCEQTVRPCGEDLCAGPWNRPWSNSPRHGCGCSAIDRIPLAGNPSEIVEVLIDGEVVDPVTYELNDRMWLDRVNDPSDPDENLYWPSCENKRLPITEEGTFAVTYRYGSPPPVAGMLAAQELACAVYGTCSAIVSGEGEADCALPAGVTQVVRQGITISLQGFAAWGQTDGSWQTGLPLVDAFLNGMNPSNSRGKAQVWSPDLWKYPRPLGVTAQGS